MSENNDLSAKMFPDIRTDHGGINLGDVLVLIITAAMLLFTGFRSWDIIRQTVPPGWDLVAYAGLLALDGGMLAWSLVWILGSTTPYQDWIALSMWGVDVVGVGLAAIADTFFYPYPIAQAVKRLAAGLWRTRSGRTPGHRRLPWSEEAWALVEAALATLDRVRCPVWIAQDGGRTYVLIEGTPDDAPAERIADRLPANNTDNTQRPQPQPLFRSKMNGEAQCSPSRGPLLSQETCTVTARALNVGAALGVEHPVVDWLRRGQVVLITETVNGWECPQGWLNLTYGEITP